MAGQDRAGQDRAGQGGEVIPKYVGEGKPLRIHRSFLVMFLFRTDPEEVQTWRYPWDGPLGMGTRKHLQQLIT